MYQHVSAQWFTRSDDTKDLVAKSRFKNDNSFGFFCSEKDSPNGALLLGLPTPIIEALYSQTFNDLKEKVRYMFRASKGNCRKVIGLILPQDRASLKIVVYYFTPARKWGLYEETKEDSHLFSVSQAYVGCIFYDILQFWLTFH